MGWAGNLCGVLEWSKLVRMGELIGAIGLTVIGLIVAVWVSALFYDSEPPE